MWNYERFGLPRRQAAAGFVLYEHNDGLQNQNELWIADGPDAEGRVLLDANELSADGTVSLTTWALSPDGKYLAYGTFRRRLGLEHDPRAGGGERPSVSGDSITLGLW